MSSALSCFRKPWLGRMQRRCRTCSIASTTEKLCFIIRYARTRVADLLRPITQCTSTLSTTKQSREGSLHWKCITVTCRSEFKAWLTPRLTLGLTKGLVDELGCRMEEVRDVEGGFVISLYTIVLNVHVTVVISTSQHVVPLSFCCVQNMCNTQILQARPLQSCFPAIHSMWRYHHQLNITSLHCVLLTHPQYRHQARPGSHVYTEPQCQSRTAAPDLMFLVWCNHCLDPPVPPCTGSCFWTSPHRRTWLTSAAQKTRTYLWILVLYK